MAGVSLVVVALAGGRALVEILEAVGSLPAEVVVLADGGSNRIAELSERFPAVIFINRDGLPVPLARRRGVEQASAAIVALLEDTSQPAAGWHAAIAEAFAEPGTAAAGGPVLLAPQLGVRYLALGCCEYGRFHPGRFDRLADVAAAGGCGGAGRLPVSSLPGNNLAYRREALLAVLGECGHGLVEGEINARLRERGHTLCMHPAMTVSYAIEDRHGALLSTRFNHGRLYAGSRVSGQGGAARLGWLLKSLLLPAVLTARGWSHMTVAVRPAAWPQVMLWILLMQSAWAFGEALGYMAGTGRSLEVWR
jgi:hypothetical protein